MGKVVAQIIGEGQSNDDVLLKFREIFLQHRRAEFSVLFARGIREGEFEPGVDVELATDLVYGPVWYRLLVAHQPLDKEFAKQLPSLAVAALAAKPAQELHATARHNS